MKDSEKNTSIPVCADSASGVAAPARISVVTRIAWFLLVLGAATCAVFSLPPAAGLLAGAFVALVFGNPAATHTHKWSSLVLKIAVVLLGAGMNLAVVWRVGAGGIGYTLLGIVLAMSAGLWLGRRAKLEGDVALLVSAGTAICGGSAIAAMSAAIKPKAHDVAVSMAAVFLLNALGLLIFPLIGHALGFSQEQFGMWSALAIHDTSSVVGAATAYGAVALSIAVTVKLTRALWIVPLTAIAGWWHERKVQAAQVALATTGERGNAQPRKAAWKRFMPQPFIIGYLVMAAVFTYAPVLFPAWNEAIKQTSSGLGNTAHRLMTLALFLIGAGLSREALKQTGARPLVMAFILWCVVSVLTATALWAGWIIAPVITG